MRAMPIEKSYIDMLKERDAKIESLTELLRMSHEQLGTEVAKNSELERLVKGYQFALSLAANNEASKDKARIAELEKEIETDNKNLSDQFDLLQDCGLKIAELEKERDVYASAFYQLKGEFVRCDNCGDQSECKDFDIFNGGTVDWLQADRDLNQQADGIESLITGGGSIEQSSMNSLYRREATKLRNKAKALKEDKELDQ